jgi:hypothetical protein
LGEGFGRLGRAAAVEVLDEAERFAAGNQIHQIAFKAQSVRDGLQSKVQTVPVFAPPPTWVPDDVDTVVRAISDLRKAAVAVR